MTTHPRRIALPVLHLLLACALILGGPACGPTTQDVPMRDGTVLATDVYRPVGLGAPTVVIRTPYGRGGMEGTAETFVGEGYSVVSQDIRGTGGSEGIFLMFRDDGWGWTQDGYDTVEWAAGEAWSNGEAGLWGSSALAITALLGTGTRPPSLKCAFALSATGDVFHHLAYQGGALREELAVNWLVSLGQAFSLAALYEHPTDDSFWDPVSLPNRYGTVNVPVYHMGGWYDIFTQGTLDAFAGLHGEGGFGAAGRQKLLMGPWNHGGTAGELVYPAESAIPDGDDLRWFDYWLKGEDDGIGSEPAVKYYLMGDVDDPAAPGNEWRTADDWPVASIPTPYYFIEGGDLGPEPPAPDGGPAAYTFDPTNPVPTLGGANLFLPAGTFDQRPVLGRPDVLLYTSPVLPEPLAVAGRIRARLWVSSSATDTGFTVKLMDIYPDGRAMLVTDGILRMRFREGQDHEVLMTPGEIYEAEVDLWSTALVFNGGHRFGVAVSSSNSPRFDVNPNTGGPLYDSTATVAAEQTVYRDAAHPSHIVLPVVPL